MADTEKDGATAVADTKGVPSAFSEAEDKIKSDSMAEGQKQVEDLEESKETPDTGEEVLSDETETPESLADIDPEVVECCRDYGWDDEKIAQIKETMPEFFDTIREVIAEQNEPVEKKPTSESQQKQPTAKQIEEIKFNLDPDMVGADVKGAIDKIASILNEQRKGLSDERTQLQSERDGAFNTRVDSFYDKAGLSDLGKTDSLSKKQYYLRSELFAHANVTAQLRGIPVERALSIEVDKYKNQSGPKEAEQRVLDKLEKQKRTYTNKPTRRLNETGRKFTDEAERIDNVMEQAERDAGLI